MTAAPNPKAESLAIATASCSVLNVLMLKTGPKICVVVVGGGDCCVKGGDCFV